MWTSFEKGVSTLIEKLLHKTNQNANREKNKPQFKVVLKELNNFIELNFLSDYNIRLAERYYWSVDLDLKCDIFWETMSRNEVFKIKSFLHAAVNQSLSESRTAKVEPLYDFLNNNFSNLVSLMKILAFMSQWYLTTAVIHVSNSYVQSQFVSDTSYEYYPVQQESFIKSTFI